MSNEDIDLLSIMKDQDVRFVDIQQAFPNVKREKLMAILKVHIDAKRIHRYLEDGKIFYGLPILQNKTSVEVKDDIEAKKEVEKEVETSQEIKTSELESKTEKPVVKVAQSQPVEIKDTFIIEEGTKLSFDDIVATRAYTKDEAIEEAKRIIESKGSDATNLLVVCVHAIVKPVVKTSAVVEIPLR